MQTTVVQKKFTVKNFHMKNIRVKIFLSPWTADKKFLPLFFKSDWEQFALQDSILVPLCYFQRLEISTNYCKYFKK